MLPALLTVFLFSVSATAGERTARFWGSQRGNLLRLLIATVFMGSVVWVFFPGTLHPATYGWLFLSGLIGFGIGDLGLFLAYVRIGARLTILLNLCLAPLWGALVEWLWLGTRLGAREIGAAGIILAGVAMAILSREPSGRPRVGSRTVGILCALLSGWGQALGAVFSRRALEAAEHLAVPLNGFSAAAQRVSGGFLFILATWLLTRWLHPASRLPLPAKPRHKAIAWLLATTFCGPILGVSAFQWALESMSSGLVLAVVATTPIAMIPLSMHFDREHPQPLSIIGAFTAVAGVILLLTLRQ